MAQQGDPCKNLSLATVLVVMLMPMPCFAVTVKGRIMDEAGFFKGARVAAFQSYEELVAGKAFSVSGPSAGNGGYEMALPEGEYYFIAQGNKGGKSYYAYHGNNPFRTGKDGQWISFNLTETKAPVYQKGKFSLTGRITYHGQPVKNAWLFLYPTDQKSFKGAGTLNQQAGKEGDFSITWLPPGKYVLVARTIEEGTEMRPIRKGELFCYYADNPVKIRDGRTVQVELPCYSVRRAGKGLLGSSVNGLPSAPALSPQITQPSGHDASWAREISGS